MALSDNELDDSALGLQSGTQNFGFSFGGYQIFRRLYRFIHPEQLMKESTFESNSENARNAVGTPIRSHIKYPNPTGHSIHPYSPILLLLLRIFPNQEAELNTPFDPKTNTSKRQSSRSPVSCAFT